MASPMLVAGTLGVIGEGEARRKGRRMSAADALAEADLAPFRLSFKEGLGLINGCQLMASRGTLLLHDARVLLKTAQAVSAAVVEALGAATLPYEERVHAERGGKIGADSRVDSVVVDQRSSAGEGSDHDEGLEAVG